MLTDSGFAYTLATGCLPQPNPILPSGAAEAGQTTTKLLKASCHGGDTFLQKDGILSSPGNPADEWKVVAGRAVCWSPTEAKRPQQPLR